MGRGMGRLMGNVRLLGIEQVQKELQMTSDQKAQVKKLSDALREEFRKRMAQFRGGSEEERRKRREEFEKLSEEERRKRLQESRKKFQEEAARREKEIAGKLAEILRPEQLKRAKQIQMQLEGVYCLGRPEVTEHLRLTDAQKEKLEKIHQEVRNAMAQLWRSGRGQDVNRDEQRKKRREFRKKTEKDCMAVLTAEQKKKLAEMMGEPFEIDRSAWLPGREGRRGQGRGGQQQRGGAQRGGQEQGNRD